MAGGRRSGLPKRWEELNARAEKLLRRLEFQDARAEKLLRRLEFQATWQPVLLVVMLLAGMLVGVFLVVRGLPVEIRQ